MSSEVSLVDCVHFKLCIVFSLQYRCIFRFMMVGDPFSGKTTVLEVLAETLNLLTDRGYDDENVNKVLNSVTN